MTDEDAAAASLPPSLLVPDLPDDVAIRCLARIPLSYHPSLSLVSKSWCAAFKSSRLYTTRCLLNCTQRLIYLNLRLGSSFHWFIFDPANPRRTTLSPLPPIPSQQIGSAFAVLGTKIYVIGGSINDNPLNTVWIFDCRFNKWELGPKMRVGREFAAAGVVNGKIYVIGGCLVDNWARSMYWAEVFDPVEGFWAAVPSCVEVRDKWMHASAVIDGKMYAMADRGGIVYDVAKGVWGEVEIGLDMGWRGRAAVVCGVLYCYDYLGRIRGYDVGEGEWKELMMADRGLPRFLCGAMMVNLGGNLCVIWEAKGKENGKEIEILCAEIEVSKDGFGGLNGSVVWCDVILHAPKGSSIVSCVGVGL